MSRTPEQILEDRREAERRRFQRWKEKQEKSGKRHISGMISAEAYDLLSRERDITGASVSSIVEKALIGFYGKLAPVAEVKPEQVTLTLPLVEPQQEVIPDYQDKGYKDYIVELVRQLKKEGLSFRQITTELKNRGLKTLA
ncbi:MAG: hypothetical protein JRI32_06015, partial [Deltaproteobacteria bacterium]|nr:hypothetical protein [Deltaproteobacteria bacterium]